MNWQNIKISVPLQELIHLPRQKSAISRFLGLDGSIDPSNNHQHVYLGMNNVDEPPSLLYFIVG
jgi:hypothetical protein